MRCDFARVIATSILAMLTEFHTEAVQGTGVQPLQKSFDDKLSPQIQPFDLVDHFGLQVFANAVRHVCLGVKFRTGVIARNKGRC